MAADEPYLPHDEVSIMHSKNLLLASTCALTLFGATFVHAEEPVLNQERLQQQIREHATTQARQADPAMQQQMQQQRETQREEREARRAEHRQSGGMGGGAGGMGGGMGGGRGGR
jgi:hypothetical protein